MKDSKTRLVPKLRFPEFREADRWNLKELGDCLDYLQPTKYLVNSTAYDDSYAIPVVTAGKTFILGYTNEIDGVFENPLPIVIFDDFTTATQYVDFPFKAKSSAMKILLAKEGTNIKFIYESMQQIDYEVGAHGRHWISAYSKIGVPIPATPEQQKIADCLSSVDALIAAQARKVDALKTHKKGLMQQLFPTEGETQPRLRFPEFRDAGEWEVGELGGVCENIASGKDKSDPEGNINLYGSTGLIGMASKASFDGAYILVARVGANAGFLTKAIGEFSVTDNTLIINLQSAECLDFIYYYLDRIGLNKFVFGSGQPLITGTQLKELRISFPSDNEQNRIASCLTSLDNLITAATQELDTFKTHKKALMQQLFPSAQGTAP